jgi:hypothetical protein
VFSRVAPRVVICAPRVRQRPGQGDEDPVERPGSYRWRPRRSRRSTGCRHRTIRSCSRTHEAATSSSTSSPSATGNPPKKPPGSNHTGTSTTCATPTPPSRPARRPRLRRLAVHRLEHRNDRPPYGQLANDSRQHAVSLLDALAVERTVDAAWTSLPKPPRRSEKTVPELEGECADNAWTLGGRRHLSPLSRLGSKGADYQGVR